MEIRQATGQPAKLQLGDVIGVDRGLYEHYGVYCGNYEVIHYTRRPGNLLTRLFSWTLRIYLTDIRFFLRRNKELFVLDCTDLENPVKSDPITIRPRPRWIRSFHLYSPEETVQRAKSQLGRGKFNLLVNNCEHFAIWCKTGLHRSYQVEQALRYFKKVWYRVD